MEAELAELLADQGEEASDDVEFRPAQTSVSAEEASIIPPAQQVEEEVTSSELFTAATLSEFAEQVMAVDIEMTVDIEMAEDGEGEDVSFVVSDGGDEFDTSDVNEDEDDSDEGVNEGGESDVNFATMDIEEESGESDNSDAEEQPDDDTAAARCGKIPRLFSFLRDNRVMMLGD